VGNILDQETSFGFGNDLSAGERQGTGRDS
jgi:hypothetical protein